MVRFRNRSLLPLLDGVLLTALGLGGLVALLTLIATIGDKELADLVIGLPTEQVGDQLPDRVSLEHAEGVATVADLSLWYRLVWWLVGPAAGLLVVAGASILRAVVATARGGDPFVRDNVRRLRWIGVLAVGFYVLTLVRSLVAILIQRHLGLDDIFASADITPLVWAAVIFALAEIWQRGVDLRDEQQLTV